MVLRVKLGIFNEFGWGKFPATRDHGETFPRPNALMTCAIKAF